MQRPKEQAHEHEEQGGIYGESATVATEEVCQLLLLLLTLLHLIVDTSCGVKQIRHRLLTPNHVSGGGKRSFSVNY
jgi:hypothetical protein